MPISLRRQRKLDKLRKIRDAFPGFDWEIRRDGHAHLFVFAGYPTVNGQRPSLDALIAHIEGHGKLRLDEEPYRNPKGVYVRYAGEPVDSLRPYASSN